MPNQPALHLLTSMDRLYGGLLENSVGYFFPTCQLTTDDDQAGDRNQLRCARLADGALELRWLGTRHRIQHPDRPFTPQEMRLLRGVGQVLLARYQLLQRNTVAASTFRLFRGLPEDRFVSAFLDPTPYESPDQLHLANDRLADAIEVLRASSLTTYENRRVMAGALLYGREGDSCHPLPVPLPGALPYDAGLAAIKSFHRLSDSQYTLALVDQQGLLVNLVDVRDWAEPFAGRPLPAPAPEPYHAHALATICGGHVCLVLTPNGEIKLFAEGSQVFHYLNGRWQLTDTEVKYKQWQQEVGDRVLAERLFTVALNMAESRHGGLFVILDHGVDPRELVAPADLVTAASSDPNRADRHRIHYLLRHHTLHDIAPAVLENIAKIDGAVVLRRDSTLLAFGAILRYQHPNPEDDSIIEGGRTNAATAASRFGSVLKISEDGIVSMYRNGRCGWSL